MLTFIGIVLVLIGLVTLVIRNMFPSEDVWEERPARFGNGTEKVKVASKGPAALMWFDLKKSASISVLGLIFILIPFLFFFADRGYNYLLVHPGGKLSAVMEQGIKYRGFAKIDEWQKFIDVKVVSEGAEYDASELEGIMRPVPLRFIDQVTADGLVSTRFQLPSDEQTFINLAVEFRSMSNLVNNTIIPTVKEQLIQTAYMFAAQDYISGEAQAFRQSFEEQLENGTYRVEKREEKDTIYSDIDNIDGKRKIREIRTTYFVEKIMENGVL